MREVIETEKIGLLAGFLEVEAFAAQALCVLNNTAAYRPVAASERGLIEG